MKKVCQIVLITILFSIIVSCKKEKENPVDQQEAPAFKPLELWGNVRIMDSAIFKLDKDPVQISKGTYKYTFSGNTPNISVGDVIIGSQGNGYIRKVQKVNIAANTMELETANGAMSDVFKNGQFDFSYNLDDMHQKSVSNGFSYTFSNVTVYKNGPLSVTLTNGQIDLNPNWFFDFGFNEKGLQLFEMSTQSGILTANITANISASQSINLVDRTDTLAHFTKSYTNWVMVSGIPVPVVIVVDLDLLTKLSANIGASISRSLTLVSNNSFALGVKYKDSQWSGINSITPNHSLTISPFSGNANIILDLAMIPQISVRLYGIAGPYASLGLMEQINGKIASPQLDWEFRTDVWLKATAGAKASILGHTLYDYNNSWESSKLSYITPHQINIISGNNQKGNSDKALKEPLKVRVMDNFNKPQSNVPVYFSVSKGGGSLDPESILTDALGYASSDWTLGPAGEQSVKVTVKKAPAGQISNSPITFNAVISTQTFVGSNQDFQFNYGGGIYCDLIGNYYNTQMNLKLDPENNTIVSAEVLTTQKETKVNSSCSPSSPVIPINEHKYTASDVQIDGSKVQIKFKTLKANPSCLAEFNGTIDNGQINGLLQIKRNDGVSGTIHYSIDIPIILNKTN